MSPKVHVLVVYVRASFHCEVVSDSFLLLVERVLCCVRKTGLLA